jgi:hypothetical protein
MVKKAIQEPQRFVSFRQIAEAFGVGVTTVREGREVFARLRRAPALRIAHRRASR